MFIMGAIKNLFIKFIYKSTRKTLINKIVFIIFNDFNRTADCDRNLAGLSQNKIINIWNQEINLYTWYFVAFRVALFQRDLLVRPCNRFFRKKAPFPRFTRKNISANQRVRKFLGPRQCAMKVRETCFRWGTSSAEIMNSNSRSHSVPCSHETILVSR